jgi:hypothetical protein
MENLLPTAQEWIVLGSIVLGVFLLEGAPKLLNFYKKSKDLNKT